MTVVFIMYDVAFHISIMSIHARIQRGGGGGAGGTDPPGKSQNIGLFSNTGSDPLENHTATSQQSLVGR